MGSVRLAAGFGLRGVIVLLGLAVLASPARAAESKEFMLRVVGPDGKPVPDAEIELRGDPFPEASQIRIGSFVKKQRYGTSVKTNAEGKLSVALNGSPKRWIISIITPGYGPYWAEWSADSRGEPIPLEFKAQLDAGWSVGGIVVDPEGKPVPNATIHPSIEFKKRPGYEQQLGTGNTVKTDAQGTWRFDSVPVSLGEVAVNINHGSFKPIRRPLARSEFGLEAGREPAAKIVLDRGLTVTGKVTNEAGKPIAGALIKTEFLNDPRETKTAADGTYKLSGCEAKPARIVASAKGYATDLKALNIEPGMKPIDFAMKPGGTVRIRVIDHQGKPVPKARIFFQTWRGQHAYFELRHVNQYADAQGVWVWNEAPLDEFQADIAPPEGMQLGNQRIVARAEEYVFRIPPPLVLSGKVIDAETKKPVTKFRAVPGIRWNANAMHWERNEAYEATDGHYRVQRRRNDGTHLIRIEAEGYRAEVSRDIRSDEGNVSLDFAIKPGKGIIAKVVTPRNQPAAGAKIAIGIAGSQIAIKNGDIDDSSTFCARETTDETGRFELVPQDKEFQLVIVHPTGYAHIKSEPDWDRARIIRLEPWARVEGTFRIGPNPAARVPIEIDTFSLRSSGPNSANIFTQHEAITGPDGKFVFERVAPGAGTIGRRIIVMVNTGPTEVTSACRINVNLTGGETTKISLGGTGRAVIGKLAPPEKFAGKVRWNLVMLNGQPSQNPNGGPFLSATVDRDGGFRIDDVPPGRYLLNAWFVSDPVGRLPAQAFEVLPAEEGAPAKPVDLGTLKLK